MMDYKARPTLSDIMWIILGVVLGLIAFVLWTAAGG